MNDNATITSEFDRLVGALKGLRDVTKSKPSTICAMLPLVGIARSKIAKLAAAAGLARGEQPAFLVKKKA